MTDTQQDGGPAFPSDMLIGNGVKASKPFSGMSLRDYFAGQALPSIIMATSVGLHDPSSKHKKGVVASIVLDAYEMADAMIKERNK